MVLIGCSECGEELSDSTSCDPPQRDGLAKQTLEALDVLVVWAWRIVAVVFLVGLVGHGLS